MGARARAMAPLPAVAAELELVLANLWLGAGETVSPLHYDEYDNVLLVLRGRKELLLFPPADLEHLYYAARLKGRVAFELSLIHI